MASLEFAQLSIADPNTFRPAAVRREQQTCLHGIFDSTAERCRDLQREPSMPEALLQLRLRLLACGNPRNHLSAMRVLLRSMCEARTTAEQTALWISVHEAAPANVSIPDWLDDDDWHAIEKALADIERQTCSEMRQMAAQEMAGLVKELGVLGDFGSQSERAVRLAGLLRTDSVCDVKRAPQKRWSDIGSQMFDCLLEHLPQGSPQAAIRAIDENHERTPGVSRLLARAVWLTGMRFIELFSCRLMQPLPDTDLDEILENPLRADRDGNLANCLGAGDNGEFGAACVPGSSPKILIIRTAKTRSASPLINNKRRALILKGATPQDLDILAATARLKTLRLSGGKREALRRSCVEQLCDASKRAFPDRADPITIHTLRHAFIEAARAAMDRSEVAALSGHTSPSTLRTYGASRRGRKSGSGAVRWTPQPDPTRAAEFRDAWKAKPKPSPEPSVTPESPVLTPR